MDFKEMKNNSCEVNALNMIFFYKSFALNYEMGKNFIDEIKVLQPSELNDMFLKNKTKFKYYNIKKKHEIFYELTKGLESDGLYGVKTLIEIYNKNLTEEENEQSLRKLIDFYTRIGELGTKSVRLCNQISDTTISLSTNERYETDGEVKPIKYYRNIDGVINGAEFIINNPTYLIIKKQNKILNLKSIDTFMFGNNPNMEKLPEATEIFKKQNKVVNTLQKQEKLNDFNNLYDKVELHKEVIKKELSKLLKLSNDLGIDDILFESVDNINIDELLNKDEINILKRIIIGSKKIKKVEEIKVKKLSKINNFDKK